MTPTYLCARWRPTTAERSRKAKAENWRNLPPDKPIRRTVRKSLIDERFDVTLAALAFLERMDDR